MSEKEKDSVNEEFKKIVGIMKSEKNGKHNENYIARLLHEKDNLRRIYLILAKNTPAIISKIFEESLLTKTTCYAQLFKLVELQLCDRIFVLPIMNGTVKNDEIKKKFLEWSATMPDNLKRYYLAKTSYWVITDFGKRFITRAWNFENEYRINLPVDVSDIPLEE